MATRGKKEKEYPPMPANWMYKRGDVYMMDLNPTDQKAKYADAFYLCHLAQIHCKEA